MARYGFTAVFVQEADGIAAYCEELPPTVGRGATIEEALEALKSATELTLAANRAMTHEAFKSARVVKRETIRIPLSRTSPKKRERCDRHH